MPKETQYDLYSFDVFDTVITRKVAEPKGIFALVQYELNNNKKYEDFTTDVKANFYQYRLNSEFYVRRINLQWNDRKEITLDDIYNYLGKTYFLSQDQLERLKQLEIELELRNVAPVKENIALIKSLLKDGKRVVFISDMYLSSAIIKQMIKNVDEELSQIKLYVSSEMGDCKTTGKIFETIKKLENVDYSKWQHTGDNVIADNAKPKKLGIASKLYKYIPQKAYEKAILETEKLNPFVQLSIGCAKNLRLNEYKNSLKAQLGASLAGPLLYPYVSWLLKQSTKKGIKRLYFIARDGYILKLMADVIIKERNLDIKTEYLYGSRKAWRASALSEDNLELYKQFLGSLDGKTKRIATVFPVSKKEVKQLVPAKIYKAKASKNINTLINYLMEHRELLSITVERSKEQRENTFNYLRKTVDYSDEHFAFVDLDGSGLTQNCLGAIFKNFYDKPIETFYFASTPQCFEEINLNKHYFTTLKKAFMGNTLELFTRAPHGQTIGYKGEEDNYEPILQEINLEMFNKWDFESYINGVLAITRALTVMAKENPDICTESIVMTEKYWAFIFNSIDKETANQIGDITHSLNGKDAKEFAPRLSIFSALHYLLTKRTCSEHIIFSRARSSKLIKKIIDYKLTHPNFRKEFFNVYINANTRVAFIKLLGVKISFRSLMWKEQ